MKSKKATARIAGLLYLLVGIFGGFSEGFVDPKIYVPSNPAATARNVFANAGLVRMSVAAHLLDGTFFIFLAMTLYALLQHVNRAGARAMLILVAIATGIICLNAVFQFEALRVAIDGSYVAAFGISGSNSLVLLLLDLQHYGTRNRPGDSPLHRHSGCSCGDLDGHLPSCGWCQVHEGECAPLSVYGSGHPPSGQFDRPLDKALPSGGMKIKV